MGCYAIASTETSYSTDPYPIHYAPGSRLRIKCNSRFWVGLGADDIPITADAPNLGSNAQIVRRKPFLGE